MKLFVTILSTGVIGIMAILAVNFYVGGLHSEILDDYYGFPLAKKTELPAVLVGTGEGNKKLLVEMYIPNVSSDMGYGETVVAAAQTSGLTVNMMGVFNDVPGDMNRRNGQTVSVSQDDMVLGWFSGNVAAGTENMAGAVGSVGSIRSKVFFDKQSGVNTLAASYGCNGYVKPDGIIETDLPVTVEDSPMGEGIVLLLLMAAVYGMAYLRKSKFIIKT